MKHPSGETSDRELRVIKLIDAPIELVWEVWTHPDHIGNWWGPEGFTNTITTMDMVPEGEWNLIMHGPDGTDFKNHSIFKELIPFQKIVYDHISGPKFLTTVLFEQLGNKTLLNWQMLFATKEEVEQVVRVFKADEGLRQNVQKLERYLADLST